MLNRESFDKRDGVHTEIIMIYKNYTFENPTVLRILFFGKFYIPENRLNFKQCPWRLLVGNWDSKCHIRYNFHDPEGVFRQLQRGQSSKIT